MKKGFAPILVVIVVVIIAISSISYALYLNKANNADIITSQSRNISQTETATNQSGSKIGVMQGLLDKMKSYKNYQLDLTIIPVSKKEVNWKFLRVGEKLFHEFGLVTTAYEDNSLGKSFTYYKDKNEYGEGKSAGNEFAIGTPEYYFKDWTSDVNVKGDDVIDGQNVSIYESINGSTTRTAYISIETGLPAKTIVKTTTGVVTTTFKFSRINEVQDAEVTLPANAKKIVNL